MGRPRHAMQSKTLRSTKYWRYADQIKEAYNLIKYQNEIDAIEALHQHVMESVIEAQKILETLRDLKKEI